MLRKLNAQIRALLLFLFFVVLGMSACKQDGDEEPADEGNPAGLMAFSYLNEGKYDEAEIAFQKAIKANPENTLNYLYLSLLYLAQDNFDDAESQIEAGLNVDSENVNLKLILSEIYAKKGDLTAAKTQLGKVLEAEPKNAVAYYMLYNLAEKGENEAEAKTNLLKILEISPSNVLARLQLSEMMAKGAQADSALNYIQSVRKIAPDFSTAIETAYTQATKLLSSNKAEEALYSIQRFHKLIEATSAYAESYAELQPLALPNISFQFYDSKFNRTDSEKDVTLADMSFVDDTEGAGLVLPSMKNVEYSAMAMADDDGTGTSYIYLGFKGNPSSHFLFKRSFGGFADASSSMGFEHGEERDAAFADYDNDGYQDLLILTDKGMLVYHNQGDGTFTEIKNDIGLGNINDGRKIRIADLDQDGDLDLYIACNGTNKLFRNNNNGSFTEQAKAMGLSGPANGTKDICFGDWDSDGDLDIALLTSDGTLQFVDNKRHAQFEGFTQEVSTAIESANALAVGDYNNDGMIDLLVLGNEKLTLLKNAGNKGFVKDAVSANMSKSLKGIEGKAAVFIDFDNDGHEDIFVAGLNSDSGSKGIRLFHNEQNKGFSDVSNLLPEKAIQGHNIEIADFNLDGDDDLFLSGPNGVNFVRNDGGSLNRYMQVQLRGLTFGNSKNNRFGIGARVELKAGDLYQMKTITRALTNFGVGMRDSLEAVRIIWPNGAPEYVSDPSRRQRFIEEEKLKGSCPFLFTWNGEAFEFQKDMMWRSALGMPLAVANGDTTYAFSDPSKEYLLISGDKLKAKDGKYTIKITEELWEAVYFDKTSLIAVDHPDSVDVFVDERFVAPPFPGRKLYNVADKQRPIAAQDEKGNDVLDKLKKYDFQYVSNFGLGKYQGIAQDHDLILDLGDAAKGENLYLFLRGWIFPADASINVSVDQAQQNLPYPPSLQVKNKKGEWQTVIPNIGFPMGKDKMVIADLSGKFLTEDNRMVRIKTNMQIYWDEAFFSTRLSHSPYKMYDLKMTDAQLDFRGYSYTYRKGGPFGPHWFDFYNTSQGQQWRDLIGYYTRFGDVLPLLQHGDDEYVIANSGDVITIDFDAKNMPRLPKGWKRDFLIYSEGWVKDGDLNTAQGQTVEPLPFHAMPSYPYSGKAEYPSDERLKKYREQYNTRFVDTEEFKNMLKPNNMR
ncbi:FG-GAP-like repeat-containing protein [Marinilongibacter aquaticus]|uniref:CRTAC1 family protein n=1 Tax=Marinilongibacter aquaticus TaxID=2975157 RepID=UPI0021BD709A|nr:CRTAC1 family protein [Marinilongibacter aquaticus]UBM60507.1 FG-GAP-like repeat-containing protein [Marinilongibacter aquaticus]